MKIIFVYEWENGGEYKKRKLNDRRLVKEDDSEYYQFKIGDNIAKCDVEHKYLLDTYRWNTGKSQNGRGYIRTSVRKEGKVIQLYFARLVIDVEHGNIHYVNGDTLEDRKSVV